MPDPTPPRGGFLERLSAEDRSALMSRLTRTNFVDGEEIVSAQEGGGDVFVILEGRAEVVIYSVEGREVSYRDAGPGAVIGEIAAIDGGARSATVTARGPVAAGRLAQRDLMALIEGSPGFALALMQHLTGLVRSATNRVFELSALLLRERLMRELLRRGREAAQGADGRQSDEAVLDPAPTQFEFAARLGAQREAISREMSRLAREGLLERSGRRLVIPSLARLAERMDED